MQRKRKLVPRFLRLLPHRAWAHVVLAIGRATLGVVLVGVAMMFLRSMKEFSGAIPVPLDMSSLGIITLAHAIVLVHLTGGLLLIPGLLTRWAAGLQLPIMAGALVLVDFSHGYFSTLGIGLTLGVALGSLFVTVTGGGRYSIDAVLGEPERRHPRAAVRV